MAVVPTEINAMITIVSCPPTHHAGSFLPLIDCFQDAAAFFFYSFLRANEYFILSFLSPFLFCLLSLAATSH